MADNIKIIGNILNSSTTSRYDERDLNLLISKNLQEYFGGKNDYIEYYLYDAGGNILNQNYNYFNYKVSPSSGLKPPIDIVPNTTGNIEPNNVVSTYTPTSGSLIPIIEIDPVKDIQDIGYSSGEFIAIYNIFQNKLSNYIDRALFIKEISQDRTEIRLASTTLTNDEIEKVANEIINKINSSSYYTEYLLNFGDNKQLVAVNIILNKAITGYELLFKLYKPLPIEIQEKDTLWIVEEKTIPYTFNINLDKLIIPTLPPQLRGPNFDIPVEGGTISTSYTNYQNALSSLQTLQNSSYHQLLNLLNTQSIQINVGYTNFENFVFFGSAYQRLYNFYNKAKKIEDYNSLINSYIPKVATTSSLQIEINTLSSSINEIISQFDGYESYLYFESGSYTWPKSGSLKPYSLLSTSSQLVSDWYNNQSILAQEYDNNNYNNLIYAVPNFIKDNEDNIPYLLFLNMVGQYFDNIWIYLNAITDINLANNNLNYGISKDLVYEQLKSLGIKVYSSQAGEALDQFLIGSNTGSSLWNNDFSPTSSYLNNIPRKDLVSELYKRIYHNLPLLLKTKGTVAGLDYLMTTFGVPNRTYYTIGSESFYTPTGSSITSSILNVKEYGGSLKKNLIKGYNNDKVRIAPNDIVTGSVLSPIASLQTYPSKSSQFRDSDMHYVDISFSPQTQINTYISGAIASNASTWSLDDYIGDPRYLYSSSYIPLDTERTKYYQTGVSGFAPFTASALDYNGFIRLIEFFDNALFKMLGDFVPERTSLSTGVTFESPVLERNKSSYARPNTYTGSVYEGEITTSSISSDYGTFYNTLGNDRKAWYDGDISGSYIDVYDYFENSNPNPYLLAPSSSFTTQSIYEFEHTDFNVLLNNVFKNVESTTRKKLEYIYGTTGSITSSAELQDSYLSLYSHNKSRYNGTRTYGLKYNDYTSASLQPYGNKFIAPLYFITSSYQWWNDGGTGNTEFIPTPTSQGTYSTIIIKGLPSEIADIYNKLNAFIATEDPDNGYSKEYYISLSTTNILLGNNENKLYKIYKNQLLIYPIYDLTSFPIPPANGIALAVSENLENPTNSPTVTNNFTFEDIIVTNIQLYAYYNGDYSYGKTTSIDRQSYKLGWVRTIQSQSLNFYEKTIFDLKYLIDPNLQITELSSNNNNLFEVQNTFKSGTPIQVSVTNVNTPSNQVKLDGPKTIFKGGFRYDPIIFRENNETLNFIFDEPISQSVEYITIRGRDDNYYFYYSADNIEAPPSNPKEGKPGAPSTGYTYTSNDSEALLSPMAANQYSAIEWTYASSPNDKINLSVPVSLTDPTYPIPTNKPKWVYEFDLMKFETIIKNNDSTPDAFTPGGEYLYKASRTSTFNVNAQIPFWFNGVQNIIYTPSPSPSSPQQCFKIVGILEKTEDLNGTWNFVEETSLNLISGGGGLSNYTSSNAVSFISIAGGFYECQLSSSVFLNEGEYLRFKFYLIDLTDTFGAGPSGTGEEDDGATSMKMQIGGGNQSQAPVSYTIDKRAYFEVIDANSAFDILYYTSSYANNLPFFVTSSTSTNTIETVSPQAYSYFESSSTFFPTTDTQNNYTQIVDNFNIKPGDIFRFGPFKQQKPEYYNVTNVEKSAKPPIYIDTARFIQLGILGFMLYNTFEYQYAQVYVGDIINITGTANNNLVNAEIRSISISGSFVTLIFDPTTSNAIVTENPVGTTLTASFITPSVRISFDKDLTRLDKSYFNPTSFAVLRPKPDETSVIIDHIKKPGEVSQTLLIPGDSNSTLKNKVGDIFDYYNPRLNPSTTQTFG
jgi:hypothetical protein